MATAQDIADRALAKILVKTSGASATTTEVSDFINAMNDYMAALESDGIRLGYTVIGSSTDTVTVPDGAIRGVVANMAIEVAPEYSAPVQDGLVKAASEGMKTLQRIGRQAIKSKLPPGLPVGTGNREVRSDKFREKGFGYLIHIVRETTATAVQDTVYDVDGHWKSAYSTAFRTDITGLAKCQLETGRDCTLSASLMCTGDDTYTFDLYVNGFSVVSTSTTLTSTPTAVSLEKKQTIYPGDEVQLKVTNTTGTTSCVVSGRVMCQS